MKAVIFARVSSLIQQKEGYSLDAQIEKLRAYAFSKGLHILQEFRITESSNIGERKKFKQVLDFVKSEHKKSNERIIIISDKVDRLIRNFKDYPAINELMENNIAELHFVGDGAILNKNSTSSDKLMWNMRIVMAQNYIDTMKDNVKRSIDYKIDQGELPCKAPLGYRNITKGKDNKSDIVFDPDKFLLVRRLFVEYSTGNYSIRNITKLSAKWGLKSDKGKPVTQTTINSVLKNRFYIGVMSFNGAEYPHKYDRLIDEETFYKCQAVLNRYKRTQFRISKNQFLFAGLLTCSKCGCSYSSEIKKSKYTYLRPTKKKGACDCYQITEQTIYNQLKAVFDSIYIHPALLDEMQKHLLETNNQKNEYRDSSVNSLRRENDRINENLNSVLDLLINKSITQDIYDKKVYEYNNRKKEINDELKLLNYADENFYESLSTLLALVSRANELFENADNEQKRKLIRFLFPNLSINGSNLEYSLKKPFDMLVNLPKCKEWRE